MYFDKLRAASVARDSLLCIGLDPEPAVIAGGLDGAVDLCRSLVERTSDLACCYKPNAAPQGLGWARHREAVRAAGRARAAGLQAGGCAEHDRGVRLCGVRRDGVRRRNGP